MDSLEARTVVARETKALPKIQLGFNFSIRGNHHENIFDNICRAGRDLFLFAGECSGNPDHAKGLDWTRD